MKTKELFELHYLSANFYNKYNTVEYPEIEHKEYVELNDRIAFIISKFRTYVKGYYNFAKGRANKYQAKKYKYTTLKYFHKELNISE